MKKYVLPMLVGACVAYVLMGCNFGRGFRGVPTNESWTFNGRLQPVQAQKDLDDCYYKATKWGGIHSSPPNDGANVGEAYSKCMKQKGYKANSGFEACKHHQYIALTLPACQDEVLVFD
jgi:hypothetical protein